MATARCFNRAPEKEHARRDSLLGCPFFKPPTSTKKRSGPQSVSVTVTQHVQSPGECCDVYGRCGNSWRVDECKCAHPDSHAQKIMSSLPRCNHSPCAIRAYLLLGIQYWATCPGCARKILPTRLPARPPVAPYIDVASSLTD